jgi:hypothetical protein
MLAAILTLAAPAAQAQPVGENPPTTTVICLDGSGRLLPATCRVPGSRLDPTEYICLCHNIGVPVTVPICGPGVKPPHENTAYERARARAMKGGSLVGATYQGQPMCVAPRFPSPYR